ncbi:MAG: hypothetical protein MI725_00460 [Pirellulales bacterium]|nr:hypothetical protein [Pirellulales bacterium]
MRYGRQCLRTHLVQAVLNFTEVRRVVVDQPAAYEGGRVEVMIDEPWKSVRRPAQTA